jgi:ferritin-like metal-binding protein YciE
LHELGDILYVEQQLAEETLPRLIEEVQDPEFREALDEHLKQTRGHVTKVEKVFALVGESRGSSPSTTRCRGDSR